MQPMSGRPRSLSGSQAQEPLPASPTLSFHEELPTTPLPTTHAQFDQKETAILPAQLTPVPSTLSSAAHAQFDQKETAILPAQLTPVPPVITRELSDHGITRQLSNPGVRGPLSSAGTMRSQAGIDGAEGTSSRAPVLIKGEMKKRVVPRPSARSHMKRRLLVSTGGVLILALATVFALLAASPLAHNIGLNISGQPAGSSLTTSNSGNLDLVVQATATAVSYQHNDGYDPYSNGGVTISDGSGSLNWPVGQCTFWANYRYHELTGHWVSWTGNAAQWVAGARAAGWNVSSQPHVPSILVLMPYVQGAYGYGHVAIVESVNDNASPIIVHTSNMNWFNGGGGWDKESDYDFTVGSGVYFVWK